MADSTVKSSEGVLRPSLLSAKADAMWTASKEQFQNSGKIISMGAIKLKTKTFSEVSANAAKKEEDASEAVKPKFIFGQNVASRLIQSGQPPKVPSSDGEEVKKIADLFKGGEKNAIKAQTFEDFKKEAALIAAKEKDEHEKNLPTTSVIEVKTGEEEDHVLFQTGCKLHVFDKQQKIWMEKGMAVMKISKRYDEEEEHYRIIARTTGIHKLVINSPVFPDMILERVDQKRLKISAMGADEPPSLQIFLVTFSFTNSELSIDGAWNTLQNLINKCKQDNTNRKRKASEVEQVSEVEAKMEKTDIDDSDQEGNKTGGFEDEQSASSVEPSDAQDPALDTDEQTNSDAGTDSN